VSSYLALALLSAVLAATSGFGARQGVLPQTLRQDAQRHGCSEIADFYDRPGRVDPAYQFGYLDRRPDGDKSAVYWCQRTARPASYLLVVWVADSTLAGRFTCPRTIAWDHQPGGLRLLRNERLALGDFWYMDTRQSGPSGAMTDGPVIEDDYDGIAFRFYCHAGKWLTQTLD